MLPSSALERPGAGRLADNVLHFARVLRKAGLPIGTDRPLLALQALQIAGISTRADLYAVLRACLIDRVEHRALFDQAFQVFWRDPELLEDVLRLLLPSTPGASSRPAPRERLREALGPAAARLPQRAGAVREGVAVDGHPSWSDRERRTTRIEPLTVIIDISGSMARYSRMFLHFVHALVNGSPAAALRVNAFVFGTRLTNVTRQLRARDPDEALARVAAAVPDWSGGTRIGACLRDFNRRWARRVPLASSTVLLLTDGLEHADTEQLALETERLGRSCRRLLWLNPLLRYAAFEPRARGIRAMLPHVDRLLPVHDLASLDGLARVLTTACQGDAGLELTSERALPAASSA